MKHDETGLTILELMMAMSISAILATVLMSITTTYMANIAQSRANAELAVESHFVLQNMIEDIRLADGIALTNTITDPNAPSPNWQTSDSLNTLVINSPATTTSNDIIYDSSTGYPYKNQLIYYVQNKGLYKRILKNTSALDNKAVTTCPEINATSSCPADRKYTSYIDDLAFTFYDADNDVTTDIALARSIKVTLGSSRKIFGKTISFNNTIQTTLRNY